MPPGQEGKIELAVEHTDGYAGDVGKAATVTTNDPKYATFSLTLRAHFKSEAMPAPNAPAMPKRGPVTIEPTDRWITSVLVGSSTASSLFAVNNDSAPIHVKSIDAGGSDFTAALTPVQDGRRYEIRVQTNPDLKPGQYHQTLKLQTDSAAAPIVPIELNVTVYPRIFASPNTIIMPTLPVAADLGTISWPSVRIQKIQSTGLEIRNVTTSLAFLKLTTQTVKAAEIYQIDIKIDTEKVKAGEFKGTIRVETNDPDMPVLEIPVQVSFK